MLRIWRTRKGKAIPHPTPTRASLESGEVNSGESHRRDSHGRLAQGQRLWEAPAGVGRARQALGALQSERGAHGGARCPCSQRRRPLRLCVQGRYAGGCGPRHRGDSGRGLGLARRFPDCGPTLRSNPRVDDVARPIGALPGLGGVSQRIFLRAAGPSRSGEERGGSV